MHYSIQYPYDLAPVADCSPFNDISSTGIELFLALDDDALDDASEEISFGRNFTFYTYPKDRVFLSTNGYLSFLPNTDYIDWSPNPIPSTSDPDNFIAPFWTDLNLAVGGSIYYQNTATEFIAQWSDVPHFNFGGVNNGLINTFQVSLSFDTGAIELRYDGVTDDGGTVTIGVENEDGRRGLSFPILTDFILSGSVTCVRINNLFVSGQP